MAAGLRVSSLIVGDISRLDVLEKRFEEEAKMKREKKLTRNKTFYMATTKTMHAKLTIFALHFFLCAHPVLILLHVAM